MTRDVVRRNTEDPRRTYQTWHLLMEEPLAQVAERHNIPFTILLYKISPFSLPNIAQVEGNWDDQQTHLYQEAMKKATLSEIFAYLMSVGLSAVYQGPTQVIKRMVLNKANTCFSSFLVFARNHRKWLHALINTMYPAVFLPLKTQWDNNKEALQVWICSTWINVSGIMHPLYVSPVIRREPKKISRLLIPPPK